MEGTVRTHSREARAIIEQSLREIIEGTAKSLGCEAVLEYSYYAAPIINEHDDINKIVQNAAAKLYGEDSMVKMPMLMGLPHRYQRFCLPYGKGAGFLWIYRN